ncbi:hypothetical protein GT348_04110 [Aristophania vespae]|uniref:Uncharacterized protein n=1 Tax=Aristophania vespae TaxID=2697033 RepID=A0A6P1NDK6_9PROT|nr:hypothetical protein [Aristophania vespae]QHI95559.1 hypothetical protein GT348_04110 [Aristophania vespae]
MANNLIYDDKRISINKSIVSIKKIPYLKKEKSISVRAINTVYIKIGKRYLYILGVFLWGAFSWGMLKSFFGDLNGVQSILCVYLSVFFIIMFGKCLVGSIVPFKWLILQTSSKRVKAVKSLKLDYVDTLKKKIEEAISEH